MGYCIKLELLNQPQNILHQILNKLLNYKYRISNTKYVRFINETLTARD